MRGAATYQKPAPGATKPAPPLTADGAVDALYYIIVSQGVGCIGGSRLTLNFLRLGCQGLIRAHGAELRWVDVGPNGRVVVVGAGRRSCEAVRRRPRHRSSIAPRRPRARPGAVVDRPAGAAPSQSRRA